MSCGQCDIACTVTSDHCISDNVTWLHMSHMQISSVPTYIVTLLYIHTYTYVAATVMVTLCFNLGHSHANIMHCLVDSCSLDVLHLLETVGTRTQSLHH